MEVGEDPVELLREVVEHVRVSRTAAESHPLWSRVFATIDAASLSVDELVDKLDARCAETGERWDVYWAAVGGGSPTPATATSPVRRTRRPCRCEPRRSARPRRRGWEQPPPLLRGRAEQSVLVHRFAHVVEVVDAPPAQPPRLTGRWAIDD